MKRNKFITDRKVSVTLLGLIGLITLMVGNFVSSAAVGVQTRLEDAVWQVTDEKAIGSGHDRQIIPESYLTFRLDKESLSQFLSKSPLEFTKASQTTEATMSLPMPNGKFIRFKIVESPIMEKALADKVPDIKTYRGQSVDDPLVSVRFDQTPSGFHAIVFSNEGIALIDPYAKGDTSNYISYYQRDAKPLDPPFTCLTSEPDVKSMSLDQQTEAFTNGTVLRTYRLAVAATGEFTNVYREPGDTDAQAKTHALAGITTTINRVTGIYERELSVRFMLVSNELNIIYTDPNTDP